MIKDIHNYYIFITTFIAFKIIIYLIILIILAK